MSKFPLHQACMNNDINKVRQILQDAPDSKKLLKEVDDDHRIPLHWAVSFQNVEIILYLLSLMKGMDIDDYKDESGWTSFHIAASIGNVDIVNALYDRDVKPDVNLQTNQGVTALHMAVAKSHYEVVEFLLDNKASVRIKDKKQQIPLHRAAAIGNLKLIEILCENQSPVDWIDSTGWTPLFHAMAEGHGDAAVLLVDKYGADAEIEDPKGMKAINVALNDEVKKYFERNL